MEDLDVDVETLSDHPHDKSVEIDDSLFPNSSTGVHQCENCSQSFSNSQQLSEQKQCRKELSFTYKNVGAKESAYKCDFCLFL